MAIHEWARVDAGVFHDFHVVWIGRLKGVLNEDLLPRPFYALAEPFLGAAEPDVIALEAESDSPSSSPDTSQKQKRVHSDRTEGAVALAPSSVLVEEIVPDPYARRSRRIVIKDAWQGDRVVAVIEVVSRGNKTSTARVEQFVQKSVEWLEKGVHLVLLDLHPPTPLVPHGFHALLCGELGHEPTAPPADRALSAVSYQVLESGALRAHLVPLKVGDPLPELAVFLTPHEFVRLPLERTYDESFHTVPWKFQEALAGTP